MVGATKKHQKIAMDLMRKMEKKVTDTPKELRKLTDTNMEAIHDDIAKFEKRRFDHMRKSKMTTQLRKEEDVVQARKNKDKLDGAQARDLAKHGWSHIDENPLHDRG